jgi:hypothetical protein
MARRPLYSDAPLALLATPSFQTGKVRYSFSSISKISLNLSQTDSFTTEESQMALSHNSLIRGFNGIYQQAPLTSIFQYKDFIGYCLAWHKCVEEHHHYEEVHFFPAIEGATGAMDGEVEQHSKVRLAVSSLTRDRAHFCSGFPL